MFSVSANTGDRDVLPTIFLAKAPVSALRSVASAARSSRFDISEKLRLLLTMFSLCSLASVAINTKIFARKVVARLQL